jgi:hypothetical protein
MTEKSFYEYEKNAWTSDISVIKTEDIKILVDFEVLGILSSISKKIDSEFSVLFKSKVDSNAIMVIPEYYIPEQEVSSASVDYLEDLSLKRKDGFDVVVHKHPSSITSFSSEDYRYINSHFPVSLLFCNGKITAATILTVFNGAKIIIDVPEDKIIIFLSKEYDINIDKIKEKKYTSTLTDYYPYHYNSYYPGYSRFNEYNDNRFYDSLNKDKINTPKSDKQQKLIEKEFKKIKDILNTGGKNAGKH